MNDKEPVSYRAIGARLPAELVAKLDRAAQKESRTRSNMLQLILEKALTPVRTTKG